MSLEQQAQVSGTALESEKSRCRALGEGVQAKSLELLTVQREVQALKEEVDTVTKKVEESGNHVMILASSCNESKMIIAAKEKVQEPHIALFRMSLYVLHKCIATPVHGKILYFGAWDVDL